MNCPKQDFLLTMYEITGMDWELHEDLVANSLDSLEVLETLQKLEERYNVILPYRSKLPLSYLLELIQESNT
jgi:hypothetical protein